MRLRTKIIITVVSMLFFMLFLPWLAIALSDPADVMGIFILVFFAVNPLLTVLLCAMAAADFKKLWWIPILISVAFPLLFAVAIGDLVWDLYLYSLIYLLLGALTMFCLAFIRRLVKSRRRGNGEL